MKTKKEIYYHPEQKVPLWKVARVLDEMGIDSTECIGKILEIEGYYDGKRQL